MLRKSEFTKSNGYILVSGSETNAYSTLWNIKDNSRCRKLEDLMIQVDLMQGNKISFNSGMGSSMTDVTIVMIHFADWIKNWQVSNRNMLCYYITV